MMFLIAATIGYFVYRVFPRGDSTWFDELREYHTKPQVKLETASDLLNDLGIRTQK